jgi:hypothetical protein
MKVRLASPSVVVLIALTVYASAAVSNGVTDVSTFSPDARWFSVFHASAASPARPEAGPYDFFDDYGAGIGVNIVRTPTDGGIRENVPRKYRERFEKWKAELLSTEYGREQWDKYANNKNFILTITVAGDRKKGAGTDKFLWDDEGRFVGATITLGANLDDGYPNPIYYPVLNSLSSDTPDYSISGRILAATKISHEIGHVNQAASANMQALQLQNKLMPEYISIFLKNGLNTQDSKLVELADKMGGTPVEIWESREYWSEVTAMLYLGERISKEDFYCRVFNKIRWNLETYAQKYEPRFGQHPEFADSPCWK